MSDEKKRKGIRKMRLFLMKNTESGLAVIDQSAEGDIRDSTTRAMVEKAGDGEYFVVTGRIRVASLSRREVVDFSLE